MAGNQAISQMPTIATIGGSEKLELSVPNPGPGGGYLSYSITASALLAAAVSSGAAPLNSPVFTGTPQAPTPLLTNNSNLLATTAFVQGQNYVNATGAVAAVASAGYALLASPTFSGVPAAPTATLGTSTTQIATTAFAAAAVAAAIAAAISRTAVNDANYTILTTDRLVAMTAMTGAHTLTLPAASAYPTGYQLVVIDESGTCGPANTISVARAGSDTINGSGSSIILSSPYAYLVLESNGSAKWTIVDQTVLQQPTFGHRLTLTSATPVLAGPVNAVGTVYLTPYLSNIVPLWNGSQFVATPTAELSNILANAGTGNAGPTAATASNVYDLFVWSNAGVPTLSRGPTWTAGAVAGSNTQRGTGAGSTNLTRVQGVLVNQLAITNGPGAGFGTYVGSIATDSTGATVTWNLGSAAAGGGAATLNLWNNYNRCLFTPIVQDSTGSHSYTAASIRSYDASNTNRINLLFGLQEDGVDCNFASRIQTAGTSATGIILIGLDSTSVEASGASRGLLITGASVGQASVLATYQGYPGLGAHYLQALEFGDGTNANVFYGVPYMNFAASVRM